MKLLDCTREEALDIIKTDEIIDKGGKSPYDLPKEKEKIAKKYINVSERKSKSADDKRGKVRAENPTKAGIIAEIAEFLEKNSNFACENVQITNKERQIALKIGENAYEITLVQKRKPKN